MECLARGVSGIIGFSSTSSTSIIQQQAIITLYTADNRGLCRNQYLSKIFSWVALLKPIQAQKWIKTPPESTRWDFLCARSENLIIF